MAELLRRTIRFYDDEEGIAVVNMLNTLINTNKGSNERLVEDIYIAELLRKHYQLPLREVLVMLTLKNKEVSIFIDKKNNESNKEPNQIIDVKRTLSMLDSL
jgi:hypothetical protein